MKTTNCLVKKSLALILAVAMLLATSLPVFAASGGVNVTTTPFQQFCGANIKLGGTDYLCAVDLGAPVVDSASDTALTAGSTVRFDLFFCINGAWYACRVPEMQGTPDSLFTVQFDVAEGAGRLSNPVWKTYPDDGYGERYYLEFTVLGGADAAPIDVTVALTQPDVPNVGAAYRITGTSAAYGPCAADFALPGYTGPCDVYFGNPVTSTGDPAKMVPGATVCFPLMFMGGDGSLYAAFSTELQGNPADLFTVTENSDPLLTGTGWKTWGNGHWYLEYTVGAGNPGDTMTKTVQLTQPYKQSPAVTQNLAMGPKDVCSVPISIDGTVYDCTVDLRGYITSTGDDNNMTANSTVCFPLMFQGGDGQWYAVLSSELQGSPADLFTVSETKTAGGSLLTSGGWKTWENGHYYYEYAVADSENETALDLTLQLKQNGAYREGEADRFVGKAPASDNPYWKTVRADISIGGTVYECIVDLQGYLTSTGGDDLTNGSTICFPLMFQGGDSQWYPVLQSELQGIPADLFTVDHTASSGGSQLSFNGWGTWDNGHYFAEYKVNWAADATELAFTAQLKKGSTCSGTAVPFDGTIEAKPIYVSAPISLGGTVYSCLIDFGDPITSTGSTDQYEKDTVCFPLNFMGGDGQWYPVLSGELQGTPASLFTVKETFTAGGQYFAAPVWKSDWPNGAYYLEYTLLEPAEKTDVKATLQLEANDIITPGKTFTGTVNSRYGQWARDLAVANPAAANQDKVILIGTSTIEYWQDYATHMSPLACLNFGMGGSLIEHIAGRNDQLLVPYAPKAVVIRTGGNDITAGRSTDAVINDLTAYLQSVLNDLPDTPVFYLSQFVTPSDTDAARTAKAAVDVRMKALCDSTENLYYIDHTTALNPDDPALFAEFFGPDQVHLSQKGYSYFGPIVAEAVCDVLGEEPTHPMPEPAMAVVTLPIKISGTVYDCIVDLQGFLTSSGSTNLTGGGTVAFPLMFMGGDSQWYPVLQDELQGDPAALLSASVSAVSGGNLLGASEWKTWENGHYYLEYKVNAPARTTDLIFSTRLLKGTNQGGTSVPFSGKVYAVSTGYYDTEAEALSLDPATQCIVPIKINGTTYDCITGLQGYLTSSGSETLEGGGTVAFPLMFMGEDGVWYPVLKNELQGTPDDYYKHTVKATSGGELLQYNGWGCWENGHYYLEYAVKSPKEMTDLKFAVTLTRGEAKAEAVSFAGTVYPGPDIDDQQIPLKPSASLVADRIENCEDFNTMSFTIGGVRYNDGWPIDFESPNTTSAVITDGTIIRSDLCFKVNGQWYPVRQQECNESVADLFTYHYEVLYGDEFLGVPRFTTRYDTYGDIWQFEVGVNSEEEGEFCFTLQLAAKDGSKTGSKYQVSGRVQNGEMQTTVEERPTEEPTGGAGVWIAAAGAGVAAAAAAAVLLLRKKRIAP